MKVSDAICSFLGRHKSPHAGHYHAGLELQIDPVDAQTSEDSRVAVSVYPIRIPKSGGTAPVDNDREMPYPVELVERFGTSGWNWREKRSEFVVFDFDSGQGHEAGLTDQELEAVQQAAASLPYVEVYRSKSGRGLHFYVFLDGIQDVMVRKDHRLVSLAVIARMSQDAGFAFAEKSDCEGVIAWLWSRSAAQNGFELVKEATERLQLPANWRDLAIASQRKSRSRPYNKPVASILSDLAAANDDSQVDEQHDAIIDWLCANGWVCVLEDYNVAPILRTHTAGLKAAHKALKLRGVFETKTAGNDPQKPNCYCFFRPGGRLVVRRYGPGCPEAATWQKDGGNWTYCNYNEDPDFNLVCKATGGVPTGRNEYRFANHQVAIEAMRLLGAELILPERLQGRPIFAKESDGGIFLTMREESGDREEDGPEWRLYRRNWEKLVEVATLAPEPPLCEHYVRRLTNRTNKGISYVQRCEDGVWRDESTENCKLRLLAIGLSEAEAKLVLGKAVARPWMLVNDPFGPEYKQGRIWNRDGAQFAIEKASNDGPFTTWNSVFEHCGEGLNDAVADNAWCQEHGIRNGRDYLMLWAASLFQKPKQRLPYLFFFSEDRELGTELQNTGKSTFHEAIGMLMTKGYSKADAALTNPQGFNGELESAILCVVEETDVSGKGSGAYNRIKEWVTAPQFNIHRKGATPYMSEFNSTHWVQCANRLSNCPVFDQDTRIVVIDVKALNNPVPQDEFKRQLEVEAPYFLRHVLSLQLPPAECRLYLPVLESEAKRGAMAITRSDKSAELIRKLLTLASDLKIWEKGASQIHEAWKDAFPNDKAPSAVSLGKAIREFKDTLEQSDCCVKWRELHGKTQYIIAPNRVVDQIDAGKWEFIYADDGEIKSIVIDPNDPEASDENCSNEDDIASWNEMAEKSVPYTSLSLQMPSFQTGPTGAVPN